ncbi:MAG: hypothetical protein CVV48_00025 [Spirochaetae bacterium HGW-Spirochaetae-4]|nr:MAG: hypothetical protein CVV48_00025 [Spirochaetae bacterium HGW-Spirochaetae-4]
MPFISKRSEWKGASLLATLPSECRERTVQYPAPWGNKGGNAFLGPGLALEYCYRSLYRFGLPLQDKTGWLVCEKFRILE